MNAVGTSPVTQPLAFMSSRHQQRLKAHLRRHARTLHNIACGFGRRRDADDIIQILYARWWQRMRRDPSWTPPNEKAALFVCVKRVVLDEVAKERRRRERLDRSAEEPRRPPCLPDESLHAMARLQWILARLPAPLAEALQASLAAGRRKDGEVAAELGITPAAYTARLFKARRAAEELAAYFDVLPPEQAHLMAELRFSGKTRAQIAHELSLLVDDLACRWHDALAALERGGRASALRGVGGSR